MADLEHLRDQARRCLRLAGACSDRAVAERLRLLAADLTEQADDVERLAAGRPAEGAG
jgi:hypothetical protein